MTVLVPPWPFPFGSRSMSGPQPLSAIASSQYAAIEATIGESERGRWFLAEHARRNRAGDTEMLLGAIVRLEQTVMNDRGPEGVGHLRGNLVEMADVISRTKAEIAAISAPDHEHTRLALASQALDAIVRSTERAASDILGSAEAVQEAAWALREGGVDPEACDALDRHATAIYTACSFQDLTAQRTARIVYTLRYLEDRLKAMIEIWGRGSERVPPMPGETAAAAGPGTAFDDLCQTDIDRYIAMEVPAVTAAAITGRAGSPALHEDIVFVPFPAAEANGAGEAPEPGTDDAAAFDEAWPGPDARMPEGPALSLSEIGAMPAEARLALFA